MNALQEIRHNLTAMKDQFKMALPTHIAPDKFIRVLQTAINNNQNLANANRISLYAACMQAAQDGLLPDGKESALVMFKDRVAYMPMVSGILKKVRNSGELLSITSQIIFKNDDFKFYVDENGEHLHHTPNLFSERGDVIGAYAIAKTKDGGIYIEVMSMEQLESVRKVSRSADSGPWAGAFKSEMYRKTVIRRLAKRLPLSTDIEKTLEIDNELFMPEEREEKKESIETTKATTKPKKLNKLLESVENEIINDEATLP